MRKRRGSKAPDTFSFRSATLELPTRESGSDSLSGDGKVGAGEVPASGDGAGG